MVGQCAAIHPDRLNDVVTRRVSLITRQVKNEGSMILYLRLPPRVFSQFREVMFGDVACAGLLDPRAQKFLSCARKAAITSSTSR
jgi:hypothetical protein